MNKSRLSLVDYLKEVSIVVIGVLIAVSVGNYREKLGNEAYLIKTLAAIKQEVLTSRTEVDSVLQRHLALYEKLALDSGQEALGPFIARAGGFQVATVKNLSLRFFISQKAELLAFDLIARLMDIELRTQILANKVDRLATFSYEHFDGGDEKTRMKFGFLLADIIDSEQSLLEAYAEFLEEYQAELGMHRQGE